MANNFVSPTNLVNFAVTEKIIQKKHKHKNDKTITFKLGNK